MPNLIPLPIDLFSGKIPEDILYIFQKLQGNNFEVFLVGGAVRDLVLCGGLENAEITSADYDFTTNAKPEEVTEIFREKGKSKVFSVPTGIAHGTVSVIIERDGVINTYEITTYRIDGQYKDGRHPENIFFTDSLEEDLSRRDFTINAMAYEAVSQKLYDPFNGLKDIENKIIQTVGSPIDRFREDGLRPIRACRFAAQLEFSIHPDTLKAITETLDVIGKVSMERIHDELMKLMKAKKPSTGFEYLRQTGVLRLIMPELLEGYQVMQNEYHKYDVYYHNLYTCDAVSRDYPLVRFAAIVHDIGKPRAKNYAALSGNGNVFYNHEVIGERMADRILKRLKFSNSDSSIIKKLVKIHMFYYTEEWTDGAVRRFLRKMEGDMEMLEYLFLLRKADRIGSGMKQGESEILEKFKKRIDIIIKADNALKVTDLDINGDEIMDYFHLKPSKTIGDMLEYMLERVLDNPEYNVKEKLYELGEEFLAGENKGDH